MAGRDVTVALDLGSEATVAFARIGAGDPFSVPLQHFAAAFTQVPATLKGDDGAPSHRIRSRYAARPRVLLPSGPEARTDPAGFEAVLPEGHATLPLVDLDRFARDPGLQDDVEARERSLFRFFDDERTPVDLDEILPNAKLVFARSVGEERRLTYRDAGGRPGEFRVRPTEMIVEQTAALLETFVRRHPKFAGREWDRFDVVLTVPNTYSPTHRRSLSEGVERRLPGSRVRAISESDAIVHAYWTRTRPSARRAGDEIHRIATFDVGKGTVDLSLMNVEWGLPPEGSGLDAGTKVLVNRRIAQAGGAWGGARVSFAVARLLESLLARAWHRTTGEGLPFGLTFAVPAGRAHREDLKTILGRFERVVEAHKRRITEGKRFADLRNDDLPAAADARAILRFLRGPDRAFGPDEIEALEEALMAPETQRSRPEAQIDFREFDSAVDVIVAKALSYVGELARGLLSSLGRTEAVGSPTEAIRRLGEAATEGEKARTVVHFVVSGQGARFGPLRAELERTLRKAGMPEPVRVGGPEGLASALPIVPKKGLLATIKDAVRLTEDAAPAERSLRVSATFRGADRKDACARGALDWGVDHTREDLNPDAELGLLVLVRGGEAEGVDMDRLQRDGAIEMAAARTTASGETIFEDLTVHYLPSRGSDPGEAMATRPIARITERGRTVRLERTTSPAETGFTFRILLDGRPVDLNPDHGGTTADETTPEDLRALLWPSRLMDDPDRAAWIVASEEEEIEE